MYDNEKLVQCCQEMEEFIQKLECLIQQQDLDELEKWKKQCHELHVMYTGLKTATEEERRRYIELIQHKDIQIKIYQDSYHLIIQSKWWKLTKCFRYIHEVIQKRVFHKKTMTEMLCEIADMSRYERMLTEMETATESPVEGLKLAVDYSSGNTYNVKVSIVIPTYNPGPRFKGLLAMLKAQVGIRDIEVIVVDSGSNDETIDICKKFDVETICISQAEFSHSYARNLGAEKAKGDYLLFMTQDAEPTDSEWLYRLVSVVEGQEVVAASPSEDDNGRGDMKYLADSWNHHKYLGIQNGDRITKYSETMNSDEVRRNAQLTDVSCIIKKDIFDQYRYEGDYAEDLQLGMKLIKDGYSLAQLSSVKVKHTHRRTPGYLMKRAYVDNTALRTLFPDMPYEERNTNQLCAGIVNGYKDVCAYIGQMQDTEEHTDVETYCLYLEQCLDLLNKQADMQYGMAFSDQFCDDIVRRMDQLYMDKEKQEDSFFIQTKHYIRNILIPYLKETKKKIGIEDRLEVKETIYKAYVTEVGSQIAIYALHHNDEIKEMAEVYFVGV